MFYDLNIMSKINYKMQLFCLRQGKVIPLHARSDPESG